ncbi:MAG: TIGR04283 family arsenosugar biosynthesis glycosyltransferase [Proteobacteria bacterium]|nr:TIGR04283 family arsenosugar biosynthesis glycosyltransferase [Pseudomonadota bacterium]
MSLTMISVIIPTLNEEKTLQATIDSARAEAVEIIVSDGGSEDATLEIAEKQADMVISAASGRGEQMNVGAAAARGEALLFLHADTLLPEGWVEEVVEILKDGRVSCGAFRFALPEKSAALGFISAMVNLRSKWLNMPYGDQAIFMRRKDFEALGGFKAFPIMEDVELVRRLRKKGRLKITNRAVVTSARRWRKEGWLWTTLRNQILLYLYLLGVQPERLYRFYRMVR